MRKKKKREKDKQLLKIKQVSACYHLIQFGSAVFTIR